jgi:hypothetical protein
MRPCKAWAAPVLLPGGPSPQAEPIPQTPTAPGHSAPAEGPRVQPDYRAMADAGRADGNVRVRSITRCSRARRSKRRRRQWSRGQRSKHSTKRRTRRNSKYRGRRGARQWRPRQQVIALEVQDSLHDDDGPARDTRRQHPPTGARNG